MHLLLADKAESLYAAVFSELIQNRASNEPSWLRILRQKSFDHFENVGFPTVADEDWKYTNVAPIARETFEPIWVDHGNRLAAGDLSPFIYNETRRNTFVFVDGVFQPDLVERQRSAEISVMRFADALPGSTYGPAIRNHYERNSESNENGFTALNTAFADGVLIVIPANTTVETPIHLLLNLNRADGWPPAIFPRVLVIGEENSAATIVETYVTSENRKYLTNALMDFVLERGANIQHYKLQRESIEAFHIATTRVDVGADAAYEGTAINFGAALSRSNIEVRMDYPGARCSVDGLYMISGDQHSDTHSVIDHRQPHCTSHQLYKGVLDGRSHAVFNGKVFVRHGAQQTDAQQTNKNLLLSDKARIDTKPQLEIFADDVKCAHGAAVGQLDEDELFYLESRGINPGLAKNILTYGFAQEVIEKIQIDSIKRELGAGVLNRLHSNLEIE